MNNFIKNIILILFFILEVVIAGLLSIISYLKFNIIGLSYESSMLLSSIIGIIILLYISFNFKIKQFLLGRSHNE